MIWNDLEIPAKLYFKIIDTNDLSLLGGETTEEREQAWSKIVDEDYLVTKNTKIKSYLDRQCKIAVMELHIQAVRDHLYLLTSLSLTESNKKELAESLKELGVKIDVSKNIIDECHRVLKSDLGIMKNKLNMLISSEPKKQEHIKRSFESDLVAVENVLMRPLPDNVSLIYFREATKSAKEKSEANKKSVKRNGK